MRLLFGLFAAALALSACDAPQPQVAAAVDFGGQGQTGQVGGSSHIQFLGGDGSAVDQAILIYGARGEADMADCSACGLGRGGAAIAGRPCFGGGSADARERRYRVQLGFSSCAGGEGRGPFRVLPPGQRALTNLPHYLGLTKHNC